MKRFLILTKAMTLMHLRNGYVLFWNFAFPVLLMFIYGAIMSQFMDYMTPGVIVLNALSFGLVSSSTMMLEMREKSVLRRLQATPLPAGQLVGSYLLVNIIIGGLFAVIALNFTIYSTYEMLGSADNPVSRLFALNYITLGIGLLVNVVMFRYGVIERLFGRYVQEQLYLVLAWAIPVTVLTAAGAVILVAIA